MRRLAVVISTLALLLLPATAFAWDPLGSACSGAGSGSAGCSGNGNDPISGSGGILMKASLVIATIAGITAVIIILVSAFRYITSSGDAQKAASARSGVIGAAIGLAIIMASEAIIAFVISKL